MSWTAFGTIATVGILVGTWLQVFGGWEQIQNWYSGGETEVHASYGDRHIILENNPQSDGTAEILNVQAWVEEGKGDPLDSRSERKLPACLEPSRTIRFLAPTDKDTELPFDLKITWKDENGNKHVDQKTVFE